MSIQTKIDKLAVSASDFAQEQVSGMSQADILEPSQDDLMDVGDPLPVEEEPEGTQVAGLGSVVGKITEGVTTSLERMTTAGKYERRTGEPIPREETPQVELDIDPEAQATEPLGVDVDEYIETREGMPTEGKPAETIFNLDNIDYIEDNATFKQHVEAVSRTAVGDVEVKSYDDIITQAEHMGWDKDFVSELLDPNIAAQADPRYVWRMMTVMNDASTRSFELAQKVVEANKAGGAGEALLLEFRQAVTYEGLLARSIKRKQSDVARSLGILSKARKGNLDRAAETERALKDVTGDRDTVGLAQAYVSSPKGARSRVAEAQTYDGAIIGTGKRIRDIWLSTWINGLLANPKTHAKNFTANLFYTGLHLVEKGGAAAVGTLRRGIYDTTAKAVGSSKRAKEQITPEELMVDMIARISASREALALAGKAMWHNKQITGASKIQDYQRGREFLIDLPEDANGASKMLAKALKGYGDIATLPGRALIGADELFKVFHYRGELASIALRQSKKNFDGYLDEGMSLADARAKANQDMLEIMDRPTPEQLREALDFANEMTFTAPPKGKYLPGLANAANSPIGRMYFTFFNVMTQIASGVYRRTPAALISPRFWSDMKAGGTKADMAISRAAMGSATIYGLASYGMDGTVTGAGPYSAPVRQNLLAQGWQPYSIVLNPDDISPENLEKLKQKTKVSVTPNALYVSYAGLEPIGAMLGISATLGEYSQMTGNDDFEDLFMGTVLGLSDYTGSLPFMKGVSDLTGSVLGAKDKGDAINKFFAQLITQPLDVAVGGTPAIGTLSGSVNFANRLFNPEVMQKRPFEQEYYKMQPWEKSWYEVLQNRVSNNPVLAQFLDKNVEPQLDSITGQVRDVYDSDVMGIKATAIPFNITKGKWSPAYGVLNRLSIKPERPENKLKGVTLNGKQYNKLVRMATTLKIGNKTLEQAIASRGNSASFDRFVQKDIEGARDEIIEIQREYYAEAERRLLKEDGVLQFAILEEEQRKMKALKEQAQVGP